MTFISAYNQGLYLSIQPLSPMKLSKEERAEKLLAQWGQSPGNQQYLKKILSSAAPAQIIHQRLSALECFTALLIRHLPGAEGYLTLFRDERGRPFVRWNTSGLPPMDFNISHTKQYVGSTILIGEHHVGLDIEDIMPESKAIALGQRYFSEEEKQLLNTSSQKNVTATLIWTAKEALSKQNGGGYPLSFDSRGYPADLVLHQGFAGNTAVYTVCAPAAYGQPIFDDHSL
ncbi:MAG: 4'-phosphopantetheinyl transferase superfamily protein [Ruminococcaceae bacterium]|nr:4'-phosphopantetheinyl transferase superfamily protein [Oscillospiraceae bacterium]